MSDEEGTARRSSRRVPGGERPSGKQAALEALKAARRSGVTHRADLDTIDKSIYEEVDEDEYERIQADRQKDFVVGDDLGEYRDDGRELDDLGGDYTDEEEERRIRKEKKLKKKKKGGMDKFLVANYASNRNAETANQPAREDLDAMLNEIVEDEDDEDVKENLTTRAPPQVQRNPFKRKLSEQVIEDDLLAPPAPAIHHPERILEIKPKAEEKPAPVVQEVRQIEPVAKKVKKEDIPMEVDPEPIAEDIKQESQMEEPWEEEPESQEPIADAQIVTALDPSMADFVMERKGNLLAIRMYYMDAFEDYVKHPGTVYMFGRVQHKGVARSCCIVLKNIERQFFVMVKQGEAHAAYEELRQRTDRMGIKEFKCRKETMKISFEKEYDPHEEYEVLEIRYSTQYPRLPSDLKGNFIEKVYNTTSTALEQLLVEQKIKGPGWLNIYNAEEATRKVSYCNYEFVVDVSSATSMAPEKSRLKSVEPLSEHDLKNVGEMPRAKLFAINVVTTLNSQRENEIAMISVLSDYRCNLSKPNTNLKTLKRITLLRKVQNFPYDFATKSASRSKEIHYKDRKTESELLKEFLELLAMDDPDVIVGHDMANTMSVLVSRLEKLKVEGWSRMSRLRRSATIQKLGHSKSSQWELTAGRLVIDSKTSAMELVRLRSYDLEEVVKALLNEKKRTVLPSEVASRYANSLTLLNFIDWSYNEALYPLRIVAQLNAIPLFLQITNIVGGVMSRTLMGGRAERNEYLLLHAFKDKGYIAPDKYVFERHNQKGKKAAKSNENEEEEEEGGKSKKAQYAGGLVLEPKKGLYDTYIVLLDFNSLYPSIIQEFNVCFTTVDQNHVDHESGLPAFPSKSEGTGILPQQIRTLVNNRRQVKDMMKRSDLDLATRQQCDIKQLGLKLTANSMYGCLGFDRSRFHAKPLAAMITSKGREILMATKELVEKNGFSVIYGDTDSIMVNTNSTDFQEALKIGANIKKLVNKSYRLLELDLDGIFTRLLLCKKKKYAALTADLKKGPSCTKQELKGLDIVRRDWSVLAKDAGTAVVEIILSPRSRDEIVSEINELLGNIRAKLDAGEIPLEKFEILKQLTRNPTDYKDLKSQPHANVAQRLNKTGRYHFRSGDIVKYIVCEDGSSNSAMQRAYHQCEIKENKDLRIDVHYYLSQQVHPVVSRLCEPIEETDAGRIAEALGLDPSGYRRRAAAMKGNDDNDSYSVGLKHDFSLCDSFKVVCPNSTCENSKAETPIREVIRGSGLEARFSLEECEKCKMPWASQCGAMLVNKLEKALQEAVRQYMLSPYVCDDPVCNYETPVISQDFLQNGCTCVRCNGGTMHKTYSAKALFNQQLFYKIIFNLQDAFNNAGVEEKKVLQARPTYSKVREVYEKLSSVVARYMESNEFSSVDLSLLFAPMTKSDAMLNRFKRLRLGRQEE
ncbi:hypothetical protein QR680_008817 [Steinernema hermaphroditum]|uniref:DNA polymerase n=1 Tax=Steinernema hermaphroditum TaxID=289476 RepID=A0AA39M8S3_9BILA|nr:hypothetical protein QR680_008817 [Steinernema hermaphroditum]